MKAGFSRRALLALVGLGAAFALSQPAMAASKELRLLAWQGYADDDWVAEFEKKYDVDVKVTYLNTDDEMWAKLKGSDGQDYDLFAVNTAFLGRFVKAGLTTPFDMSKIPNQQKTLPKFRDLTQVPGVMFDGKVYGVPLCYGSIGLIYDPERVKPTPHSMSVMWDPKYKGKVIAYDASSHNVSMTALMLGIKDPFHLTDAQFEQVKQKLLELRKNLLTYYTSPDEGLKAWEAGDAVMIYANFGDLQVKQMKAAGYDIAYMTPDEGAIAWLDTWAMTKGVRDKDLAEAWVNFVLTKSVSDRITERYGYGNTVTQGADDTSKIIWLQPNGNDTKRNDIWNEVKASPQ